MNRRITVALALALAVSGVFTYWLSRKVAGRPTVQTANVRYAAAGRALDAGEALRGDSLLMIDWPASVPLKGAFAKADDLVGRVVLFPLAPGEPLLERQLRHQGPGRG